MPKNILELLITLELFVFVPKGPKQDSSRKGKKRKYDSDVSSCLCFF